jgi:hypothetical protein
MSSYVTGLQEGLVGAVPAWEVVAGWSVTNCVKFVNRNLFMLVF